MRLAYTLLVLLSFLSFSIAPTLSSATDWLEPNTARKYNLYYGGIRTGYMLAEIRKNSDGIYRFETRIKSSGILHWITKYQSTTIAIFKVDKKGIVTPLSFHSTGKLRKRKRSTILEYDQDGNLIKEIITPPKKPGKREAIPPSLIKDTLDPLSAAFFSRELIKLFAEETTADEPYFNIKAYDGKRLANYQFTIHGYKDITLDRQKIPAIEMSFARKPLMGFSKKEMKRMNQEPIIHIFFRNDNELLPVRAEANIPYGTAVIIYDHECPSIDTC